MSLRFATVAGYANLNGAAALGNSTNGTLLQLYRKEDSTNGRDVIGLTRSGGGALIQIVSATQIRGGHSSNLGGMTTYNVANGVYVGLALTLSDSLAQCFVYDGALTLFASDNTFYTPSNLTNVWFGDQGPWGDGAVGCRRYGRVWSRVLSSAEILAEFEMVPSLATPAASLTGLRGSWLLPDATTGTDISGVGNNLTISGGSTSADEPPIGGAQVFIPTQYRRTNSLLRM
jgi:hypothetical protein